MKIQIKSKYAERRRAEYPDLAEQLDALWHGMNNNPEFRVEPWFSIIKGIKDRNPKDANRVRVKLGKLN